MPNDAINTLIRSLDERQIELDLSKSEVARRADMKPGAVRRLFSAKTSNQTISTLFGIAAALDIQVAAQPKPIRARKTADGSGHHAARGSRRSIECPRRFAARLRAAISLKV